MKNKIAVISILVPLLILMIITMVWVVERIELDQTNKIKTICMGKYEEVSEVNKCIERDLGAFNFD